MNQSSQLSSREIGDPIEKLEWGSLLPPPHDFTASVPARPKPRPVYIELQKQWGRNIVAVYLAKIQTRKQHFGTIKESSNSLQWLLHRDG